ncbi:MAG: glycosyltransferase [Chloroflexia bacterium]|nr:glycosyltransferase [Chloroflexia bacterium]
MTPIVPRPVHPARTVPRRPNLLMIAAREPTPGFTKTRLGLAIGMEAAANLYRAFLTDLIDRFTPAAVSGAFDLAWAFTPACCDFPKVLSALSPASVRVIVPGEGAVRFVAQEGKGWDVRQRNLLAWGHAQGYERVILTASDSPQMTVATVCAAFAALATHDVALGRVHDGGYYLIGLRGFHDVLTGVPMSTVTAADALRSRADALSLSVAELPPTFDIDEAADLDLLRAALAHDPALAPATSEALRAVAAERVAGAGVLTA